jgi:hypothetical protein
VTGRLAAIERRLSEIIDRWDRFEAAWLGRRIETVEDKA